MQLKRPEEIEWLELPRIESPSHARYWLESNVNPDGFGSCWVQGLNNVLADDFNPMGGALDEHTYRRLLERLERGEVFLVHAPGAQPASGVVRPGAQQGTWEIDPSLYPLAQNRLEWMMGYARRSRDIRQPARPPKAPASPAEAPREREPGVLAVTNPRWEHADTKRGQDSPDAARPGDTVVLTVDVSGAADGTPVTFRIVDRSLSPAARVAAVRGTVQGGRGSAEWPVKVPRPGTRLEFEGGVRRISSGPAEIPVKNEVAVRVGVFFDGTGNNMQNDLAKGTDTNIVRLYDLYNAKGDERTGGALQPVGKQDDLDLFTYKIYRNGVGTADGEEDSSYGLATGAGGVSRVEGALAELREFLGRFRGGQGLRIVDVFGFSRGAALARDFVNLVNEELGGEGVKVGFVGIYDTVASFGLGGNNVNSRSDHPLMSGAAAMHPAGALLSRLIFGEYRLDLGPESAEQIVHVTSADERRDNFPLSSLKPSADGAPPANVEEVTVVGVHSDVGGGYGITPAEEVDRIEKRTISYQTIGPAAQWQARMMEQKHRLEAEAQRRGLELQYEDSVSNALEATDTYWLVRRRSVKPGLSNVYLHLMYKKAGAANVPLHSIENFVHNEPERFAITAELQAMFEADFKTCKDPETVRAHYVHTSYRDWEDADADHRWIAHRQEPDGERDIYYNDPDEAVVPEQPAAAGGQDEMLWVAP